MFTPMSAGFGFGALDQEVEVYAVNEPAKAVALDK
jgi:hypothetical protein